MSSSSCRNGSHVTDGRPRHGVSLYSVFAVAAVFGRDPRTAAAHSGSAGTLPTVGREPHLTIPGCELILSHEASSSCSPLRLGRADEHAPCAAC